MAVEPRAFQACFNSQDDEVVVEANREDGEKQNT